VRRKDPFQATVVIAVLVIFAGYISLHDALIATSPCFAATSSPILSDNVSDHDCPLEHGGVLAQVPFILEQETQTLVAKIAVQSRVAAVNAESFWPDLRGPPLG